MLVYSWFSRALLNSPICLLFWKYKFNVSASGNTGSYGEFWFDHPDGDCAIFNPYYPHLLKWSDEMQDTIENYNAKYVKATAVYRELQKLKEEKKGRQAMNRWDSI